MKNEVTVVIVSMLVLAMLGFVPLVWHKAQQSHEQELDRVCAKPQETKWGFLAPPMEKTDVWMAREKAKEAMCETRRESRTTQ